MVWFKVDDKLHSHRKAMRAGAEALGLWVLAGSWAMDQLTDGWVPDYAAQRLTPHAEEYAGRLVAAGLWVEGERDGDKGWYFHEWKQNGQPTRAEVEKKRSDQRGRVSRWRERHGLSSTQDDLEDPRNALPDAHERVSDAQVTPPPTRPDPTRPVSTSSGDLVSKDHETLLAEKSAETPKVRGSRLPADFAVTHAMVEWAQTNTPSVNGRRETEQFKDYWTAATGQRATKRDWVAAWRTWMRNAEGRAPQAKPRNDAGWDALKDAE